MLETLRKNEKYHLYIFIAVFIYFIVLKLLGNIVISWLAIFAPIIVFVILYIIIKILKKYKCKNKH